MNAQVAHRPNEAFVVTRKLRVPGASAPGASAAIGNGLEDFPGVLAVELDAPRARVRITYDASQIGFEQLANQLAAAGYPGAGDVWSRLKRLWFGYLDSNVRGNAASGKGDCCSRPSDIYASRSRRR